MRLNRSIWWHRVSFSRRYDGWSPWRKLRIRLDWSCATSLRWFTGLQPSGAQLAVEPRTLRRPRNRDSGSDVPVGLAPHSRRRPYLTRGSVSSGLNEALSIPCRCVGLPALPVMTTLFGLKTDGLNKVPGRFMIPSSEKRRLFRQPMSGPRCDS